MWSIACSRSEFMIKNVNLCFNLHAMQPSSSISKVTKVGYTKFLSFSKISAILSYFKLLGEYRSSIVSNSVFTL